MIIKFDYNNFFIMDGENLLSISHHLFPVFTCKNRIMLSVSPRCRVPCLLPTHLRANGACEQGGANGVRCPLVATPLPCACPLPWVHTTSRGCAPPFSLVR